MSYLFTVSPDFTPDHLSGWYIFNTWLQKQLETNIHLQMFDSFQDQRKAIESDQVDLIYANPYDAAMLVREKNFLPVARVNGATDEALIAVSEQNPAASVEDLKPGLRIAFTDDPDVSLIGMIMLEPADLDKSNVAFVTSDTYVLVAKHILRNEADAGIFLVEAFDGLSAIIRKQLKVLVRSQISVINHTLMLGPKLHSRRDQIRSLLCDMTTHEKDCGVLKSLGFAGWKAVEDEEMEFMIDLMDTLNT
ncbi:MULTISPECIES: phosphate/phosphite/phosphonate ABC transporter substrate-binding protein [Methylomonas]|uniref:phosphate/phosphite/phosphonate ABC transporter substrate-binding protein n=1 Tax=Methylomonas TaxID=416 RepID=UPI0012329138|nr:phosphate/phosphite/phosphonate ABC transporter substrate-binding protein [Methylomonas rhizoryzae]